MNAAHKKTLSIRDERRSDIEAITAVTQAAFENHPVSRQTEHFIIHALREAGVLTMSIVAEIEGEVVGHLAVSPVTFPDGSDGWEGLGPLSVHPRLQRQGIGGMLMNECLRRLEDAGAKGCVLVGDPKYYFRFGFESWPELTHEGVPQENVLALAFGDERASGQVSFHPAFGATE